MRPIHRAAVLGAGVMGAQIAAHFANAGLRVALLDVTRQAARDGLARARAIKPDPFFTSATAAAIETGGFDEDLDGLRSADWIVEAIVERLDAKQALLDKVDGVRQPGVIVSSNTSGIPLASIAAGRSEDFRRHWIGTHFFNPPRYLHLLELIPTAETDPLVVESVRRFADVRLGKGVVVARDLPGFIANRIAMHGVVRILRAVEAGAFTIEEVDAITGPAIGRPKSATFRTMDLAGVDVLAHVARDLSARLTDPAEREAFELPAFVGRMIEKGLVGAKSGQGFYRKAGDDILTLDLATLEYRPKQAVKLPALEAVRSIEPAAARIRALHAGSDRVGTFLRETLTPTLDYAVRVAPEVAFTPADVDAAMRWGFGWEMGPIELRAHLSEPETSAPAPAGAAPGVVSRNAGATLRDLGNGAARVEFHSKMNAIGGDTLEMLQAAVRFASERFEAIVVGNDAPNFSVGANLMLLLLEAQEGNWDEVDLMIRTFQRATAALKYADVPVVVAPAGMALGGGCEIVLHAARVQAAAESYIGLVETGVGLIPAGGGTKELLARAVEHLTPGADLLPPVQRVFETIGFGKVSTSAAHAFELGYLRDADGVTMNRDRLLDDAAAVALQLARTGYRPPQPRAAVRVGGESVQAALKLGIHLALRAGRISDHDALIGRKLAWILAGGNAKHETTVSEAGLLDLEREAFLSLCGERRTLERIAFTLKTGKPLRN
jgi:3-hydroxyacyl-CoA dehydrogenase